MNFTGRKKKYPSSLCQDIFKDEVNIASLQLVVSVLEEVEINVFLLSVTRDLCSEVAHSK